MSIEVSGSSQFLDNLLEDVEKQVRHLIEEAEKRAESKSRQTDEQIEKLYAQAEIRKKEEQEKADRRHRQNLKVALRREELRIRENWNKRLLDQAEEKVLEIRKTDAYSWVLKDWVLEAVLGLSVAEVEINGAPRERELLTPEFLSEQEKELLKKWNLKVKIHLADDKALSLPGIMVKEKQGRLVFNNQLKTRILRKQSELRQRIYHRLFEDKQ